MLLSRFTKPKGLPILKIFSDAGMASPLIGDGRLIPVLTLDCEESQELATLLELHQETPPGDVISTWAVPKYTKKYMYLFLNFTKPVELNVAIEFILDKHHSLIDGVILSKGVYIRSSESSKKFAENVDAPMILIEVPEETKPDFWESMYHKIIARKLKTKGCPRKQVGKLAKEHIIRMRELWGRRMNIT